LKAENLVAVLTKFGPLPVAEPEAGQELLIRCLILAHGHYQFAAAIIKRITPSEERDQINSVYAKAASLLKSLNESTVKSRLASAGLIAAGKSETELNTEFRKGEKCLIEAVHALTDLQARAKAALQEANKRTKPGHGGSRRRPKAKGQLIQDAIATYAHVRGRYPKSGNPPGYGGPLLRFVHAVGKLCGLDLMDLDIREGWRVWKSRPKQS
jgi:hypothetical protein